MFTPLEIKRQRGTDFCAGCSIASIAEQYINEPCDESFSFAMGRKYTERPIGERGLRQKDAMMGAIEYGVLPKRFSSYSLETHDRNFLADWRNWESVQSFAVKPFGSFKRVYIKDIEKTLEETSLFVGLYWQALWDKSPYMQPNNGTFNTWEPHQMRGIGIKNGLLVLQNSKGIERGDSGLWYLPKEAYNCIDKIYKLSPAPWRNKLQILIAFAL
jgi:hypothetical protein